MGEMITAKDLTSGVKGMSERTMLTSFEDFLKKVENDGYSIVPTVSAFADYIEKPRADVHEWFRLHPTASDQMRDMFADTIASGAMLKKYVPNVTNFALKNWCKWEEAPNKKAKTSKELVDEKLAEEKLDAWAMENRRKFKVV
ncbi:MAG: hypothetical protein IIT64_07580 [Bacteroidaceae bacterium]|nr:hypothetical protein [Bacteroidaceae bacterium]